MGQIPDEEMYRVFNMGMGMTVIIDRRNLKHFRKIRPVIIGEVVKGDRSVSVS
jgi:phosphoribosylaminoimidazole (AIR) synthetase